MAVKEHTVTPSQSALHLDIPLLLPGFGWSRVGFGRRWHRWIVRRRYTTWRERRGFQ
jgi:hypothetical protein